MTLERRKKKQGRDIQGRVIHLDSVSPVGHWALNKWAVPVTDKLKLAVAVHVCHPRTQEAAAER